MQEVQALQVQEVQVQEVQKLQSSAGYADLELGKEGREQLGVVRWPNVWVTAWQEMVVYRFVEGAGA